MNFFTYINLKFVSKAAAIINYYNWKGAERFTALLLI